MEIVDRIEGLDSVLNGAEEPALPDESRLEEIS